MKVRDYEFYIKMLELKNRLESNLNELKKQGKIPNTIEDIQYAGTIEWIEMDFITESEVPIYKDIYVSVEKKSDGDLVTKYYDENMSEPIAIDFHDSNGIVATQRSLEYSLMDIEEGKDFKSQLKDVKNREKLSLNDLEHDLEVLSKDSKISKEQILSILKEKHEELDRISATTGISREEIQSISSLEDIDKILEKNKDDKIELKDKKDSSPQNNNNQNDSTRKDNPNIKQETDLVQKVNERYTLGDVLGVPDDCKLVVVYSTAVKDNNSSTKYTFLIKDNEGNFKSCDNLELVGGITPDNDVYSSNYNGSDVQKTKVNSAYRVKSPLANEGFILTAKTGSIGTVDLGIGQAPKMQGTNEAPIVTTPLKTTNTYNIQAETKETLLSYKSSRYAADDRGKEASSHDDNCKLTKEEVDGDTKTGEQHLDREQMSEIIVDLNLLEIKSNEYSSTDTLLADLINTYLSGNDHPTKEEFLNACTRCENEHSLTRENGRQSRNKN